MVLKSIYNSVQNNTVAQRYQTSDLVTTPLSSYGSDYDNAAAALFILILGQYIKSNSNK